MLYRICYRKLINFKYLRLFVYKLNSDLTFFKSKTWLDDHIWLDTEDVHSYENGRNECVDEIVSFFSATFRNFLYWEGYQ